MQVYPFMSGHRIEGQSHFRMSHDRLYAIDGRNVLQNKVFSFNAARYERKQKEGKSMAESTS